MPRVRSIQTPRLQIQVQVTTRRQVVVARLNTTLADIGASKAPQEVGDIQISVVLWRKIGARMPVLICSNTGDALVIAQVVTGLSHTIWMFGSFALHLASASPMFT